MSMKWIAGIVIAAALALPVTARAHEGHAHKVMGTVAGVKGNQVEIKSTDGKVVTIVLDAKTAITRGKAKLDATALQTGERVSVDYTEQKKVNTAKTIKLAEAPVASKK